MLYGMADPIKAAVLQLGCRLREYCPVGDLLPGMAYLVRRLLENTSNEGFLANKFAKGATREELLKRPAESHGACHGQHVRAAHAARRTRASAASSTSRPTDFTIAVRAREVRAAIQGSARQAWPAPPARHQPQADLDGTTGALR